MKILTSLAVLIALGQSHSLAKAPPPSSEVAKDSPNIHVRGALPNLNRVIKAGKNCHVAFLGGSITENKGGHTAMVPAWLKSNFAGLEVTTTNAGLSSTCSTTGSFRLEQDVFGGKPVDLLIVEFAVNDDQDAGHALREATRGMEGVVRHVRRDHPTCDLIMVQYVNPSMLAKTARGETPVSIAAHESVAEHYGVISVNVAAEVADAAKAERYTWKNYGGTHPGKFGYEVASNLIIAAIEAGLEKVPVEALLPEALDKDSYDGGGFVGLDEAKLSGGWKKGKAVRALLPLGSIRSNYSPMDLLRGDAPGDELKLAFEGRAVGAFVLAGPDAGQVECSVDGGPFETHELYHRYSGGLNYPRSVIFASGLKPGAHELTLRIAKSKNGKSKGTSASILSFEVNR